MFRFRCVNSCLRRFLHGGVLTRDPVLEQLNMCVNEEQVFDVVGKNKAKLAVNHVSQAVGMLWQFQKEKPQILRTVELISGHPQFLTLRVLAENKISHMDNLMLVDILYSFLRYVKSSTHWVKLLDFIWDCTDIDIFSLSLGWMWNHMIPWFSS